MLTVNVPALISGFNDPCVYRVCPDAGYGGQGLFEYVVDRTPPNFYIPAGTFCGIACIDYEKHIDWPLFTFDLVAWVIITIIIYSVWRPERSFDKAPTI